MPPIGISSPTTQKRNVAPAAPSWRTAMTAPVAPAVRRSRLRCLAAVAAALLGSVSLAHARVTQIVIKTVESPAFGGKSFGSVGQYERISGQIVGEVDPDRKSV